LAVCGGSSLDQHSNNVTLFNLVEQINVAKSALSQPIGLIPLEVHAYFKLKPGELNEHFEMRLSLVASSGLETIGDPIVHRPITPRFRTRFVGLPYPGLPDTYELRLDLRQPGGSAWAREPVLWPITILEAERRPITTH
jgi:hypothetical protein